MIVYLQFLLDVQYKIVILQVFYVNTDSCNFLFFITSFMEGSYSYEFEWHDALFPIEQSKTLYISRRIDRSPLKAAKEKQLRSVSFRHLATGVFCALAPNSWYRFSLFSIFTVDHNKALNLFSPNEGR